MTVVYEDENIEIILGEFTLSSSDEEETNTKMYTMMCKNIMETGICNRTKCTFAHTAKQLRPNKCKYDDKCINEKCSFIHSRETKEEFCEKITKRIPVLPEKIYKKQQVVTRVIRTTEDRAEEDLLIAIKTGHKFFTFIID